jgi:hypothetical protein
MSSFATTTSSSSAEKPAKVVANDSSSTAALSRLPDVITLQHATRLALTEDKAIMMDYWASSLEKKCLIGIREATSEKLLVKSAEEYTSCISKFYKSAGEYIIVTENSIYLVANDIPTRKIT